MINGQTISLATGCMNRSDGLKLALPTWLAQPELDEIVIVDWGSQVPLHIELSGMVDARVKFYRVEEWKTWCAGICHNLEIKMATGHGLLRIDGDIKVGEHFFEQHPLTDDCYWNHQPRFAKEPEPEAYQLLGTSYAHRAAYLKVNGYNERFRYIQYEDSDLYDRFARAGIKHLQTQKGSLVHIPHSDYERVKCAQESLDLKSLDLWTCSPFRLSMKISMGVERNKANAREKPWTLDDQQIGWFVDKVADNLWMCSTGRASEEVV